jgi:hypothetical protein
MPKQKVSANELAADIKSGMDDSALMQKHHLSVLGLQKGLKKLLLAGLVKQSDLDARWCSLAATVDLVLQCPVCGKPQTRKTDECPPCDAIFHKIQEKVQDRLEPIPVPQQRDYVNLYCSSSLVTIARIQNPSEKRVFAFIP